MERAMAKEAVFTMKLEPELRDAFMAEALELDRPASQIMRELMKDYLRRREDEKRDYNEFLRRKIERSRASIAAGRTFTQEEVEAEVAARRERFTRMADEGKK
jgi:predicted transcriptional regulator